MCTASARRAPACGRGSAVGGMLGTAADCTADNKRNAACVSKRLREGGGRRQTRFRGENGVIDYQFVLPRLVASIRQRSFSESAT